MKKRRGFRKRDPYRIGQKLDKRFWEKLDHKYLTGDCDIFIERINFHSDIENQIRYEVS